MLAEAEAPELIAGAYCGRVGTIGSDGWPYVVPPLHVFTADVINMHNTAARAFPAQRGARRARLLRGGRAG
jgi:nitroimidazol reductase NimA-like FMN-containing flavoprotein (pyridoxamine 5'-phosphate oxidase superfamily)